MNRIHTPEHGEILRPTLQAVGQFAGATLNAFYLNQIKTHTRYTRDMEAHRNGVFAYYDAKVKHNDEGWRISLWAGNCPSYNETGTWFEMQTQGMAAQNTFTGCTASLHILSDGVTIEEPRHFDFGLQPYVNTLASREVVGQLRMVGKTLRSRDVIIGERAT